MSITLETISPPESGPFDVQVRLTANIQVTPTDARRQASVFVGNNIADLLYGEAPDLVLRDDSAYWRVPIVLASRSIGRIGSVGTLEVNVETGNLCVNDPIIAEIEQNARRLATAAAL